MLKLPPLDAVRVFEAVARSGSFTRAANELNMTQSAVSYQIKLLEGFVGGPLFVREARGVTLNDHGRTIEPVVARALGDLAGVFTSASAEANNLLVIAAMQTFAGNWLAPRLGGFQMLHPKIAVRLDVSIRVADLEREGIDVAIRTGKGNWPGLASHFLMQVIFTAVCSPLYLAREGRPETPADINLHTLIAPTDEWWQTWFEMAGLPRGTSIARRGIEVETQHMAISLALAGHGITLASPAFLKDELNSGKLIQLFDITSYAGFDYYLVYPAARGDQRKIRLFRDWILKEAGSGQ